MTHTVTFHIGAGGGKNSGWLSFIESGKTIKDYTHDLFVQFENFAKLLQLQEDEDAFSELVGRIQEAGKPSASQLERLESEFGVEYEELGELIYVDESGNPVGLTVAEANTGIGMIDIDGEYDTTYVTTSDNLSVAELWSIHNASGYVDQELAKLAESALKSRFDLA